MTMENKKDRAFILEMAQLIYTYMAMNRDIEIARIFRIEDRFK